MSEGKPDGFGRGDQRVAFVDLEVDARDDGVDTDEAQNDGRAEDSVIDEDPPSPRVKYKNAKKTAMTRYR